MVTEKSYNLSEKWVEVPQEKEKETTLLAIIYKIKFSVGEK